MHFEVLTLKIGSKSQILTR